MGPLGLIGGRIWRYALTPADGATLVRIAALLEP